jgi:excisionase family DNA binding protein
MKLPRHATVAEVAESLAVTAGTVYAEIARGRLKAVRVGGAVRVALADLGAYLAERGSVARPAPSPPPSSPVPRARLSPRKRAALERLLSHCPPRL